ncbi:hypothetical protein C7B67_01885, partial [filamentous cyanobacterium Phorm 6]
SRGLILPALQLCLPINTTDAMLAKCDKGLNFTRYPTVPIAHTVVATFLATLASITATVPIQLG